MALRPLVEALCAIERGSAGPGERAAAALLRDSFADAGAADAHVQPFRYSPRWTDAHALHYAAGLLGPRWLAAAAGVSYALDFSGRAQWSRRLLPRGEGANAVARVPARGQRERTLVLMAHIDAAQTGMVWHPAIVGMGRRQAARTGKTPSPATQSLAAFALAAFGPRRARTAGRALLAVGLAAAADVARHRPVPGAADNACAAAGLAALAAEFARNPLEGTEVQFVATGCEESGMGGAAAWVRNAGLDPATTLVVGLDQIGAGDPHVVSGEGPPLIAHYRDEDIAWGERAGLPRFHTAAWTDPIAVRFAGLPALSIVAVRDGGFPNYHLPIDTPDRVEWDAVERCLDAAVRIARAYDGAG